MCFEFDYGDFSTDKQFDSIEDAIKEAYKDGQVEVVRIIPDEENADYETVWSAKAEANHYNFTLYSRDDILAYLFMFTDTLEDSNIITAVEKHILAKFKSRWNEMIEKENS